jgi:23S rRNA (adenine2503-C2)-methyltransferase
MATEILKSKQDESVNFVTSGDFPGYFESRYVRRKNEYFVAYLSSQSGCKQACRMCHLTATGQTLFINATKENYLEQAEHVFKHYAGKAKAEIVHFNFMARGEPLENPNLNDDTLLALGRMANEHNLIPRYCISTIMPKSRGNKPLTNTFRLMVPDLYYSIYSVNEKFRKRWLPKALPVDDSMKMLVDWQQKTRKIVKLHWAFIQDENDSTDDIYGILKLIHDYDLRCDINIVRYNPYSDQYGFESKESIVFDNAAMLRSLLQGKSKVKVVDRVGSDVFASCGTFVEK